MDAYLYKSPTPIKSIFGFELVEEGELTEDVYEGVFEIKSEQDFNNCVLIYAVIGDYVFIVHENTYTKFQCKE